MYRLLLAFLIVSFVGISVKDVKAQAIHLTQFEKAPLWVNPAQTGNYYGTLRANAIYRDQYRFIGKPFTTITGSVEYNLPFAFRKQDWISAGVLIYRDKAGFLDQTLTQFGGNIAYNLSLDKAQNSIFTLGVGYGSAKPTYGSLEVGDTKFGSINQQLSEQGNRFNQKDSDKDGKVDVDSRSDLKIGVLYTNYSKKGTFKGGFSVYDILSPGFGVLDSLARGVGINVHAEYEHKMSPRLSLTNMAWGYFKGGANAINFNSRVNYLLQPKKKIGITGGLGTRSFRSILVIAGMWFDNIKVGISYDADISRLSAANNSYKALELGVTYIYKVYKKPAPKPIIYCPRL